MRPSVTSCYYQSVHSHRDEKEEEEDTNCVEGTWTPPSLPSVVMDLMSITSPETAEAFTNLFSNLAATTIPAIPSYTMNMMSNFAHAVYVVSWI